MTPSAATASMPSAPTSVAWCPGTAVPTSSCVPATAASRRHRQGGARSCTLSGPGQRQRRRRQRVREPVDRDRLRTGEKPGGADPDSFPPFSPDSPSLMRRLLSPLFAALIVGVAVFSAPPAAGPIPSGLSRTTTPHEATGKIVCANCHLAKKLTQAELPSRCCPTRCSKLP